MSEQNVNETPVSFARGGSLPPGPGHFGGGMEAGATDGVISDLAEQLKNCEGLECVALGLAVPGVVFGGTHGFGSPRMHE